MRLLDATKIAISNFSLVYYSCDYDVDFIIKRLIKDVNLIDLCKLRDYFYL